MVPNARSVTTDACVPISKLPEMLLRSREDIDEAGICGKSFFRLFKFLMIHRKSEKKMSSFIPTNALTILLAVSASLVPSASVSRHLRPVSKDSFMLLSSFLNPFLFKMPDSNSLLALIILG